MKRSLFFQVALAFVACCAVVPARADEPTGPSRADASAAPKSVTVFPIVLNSGKPINGVPANMSKNLAEIVGLMLERGGVREIEIADTQFVPSEKDDLAKAAEAFGQFVQSRNLGTEYALYGQFLGTPGKGVDEIRLVVVDRNGKVVLSERRDRQQLAQLGEQRIEPMIASYQMVCRLQGLWGLADPNRKDAPEGKMARLWAEKSGLPTKSEQEAIKSRMNDLKKTIHASTVAVFPVRVSGKSDAQVAVRLAKMLTKEGFGRAEPANPGPKLDIKPNTNQMRILWDIARAFQDFLHKNPPAADYALLADYGIGRTSDGKPVVGGVQFVLCDRNGGWVVVALRNSHQPDFQEINPQSPDDCNRLVVEAITSDLR
ncbi:MAG: hypothetical protein ACLP9L_36055 [Thermoguttaceae bacterium]